MVSAHHLTCSLEDLARMVGIRCSGPWENRFVHRLLRKPGTG